MSCLMKFEYRTVNIWFDLSPTTKLDRSGFFSVLHIQQNHKIIFKESKNCGIPASFQVPLSDQQDEEVAVFLRQFTTQG